MTGKGQWENDIPKRNSSFSFPGFPENFGETPDPVLLTAEEKDANIGK